LEEKAGGPQSFVEPPAKIPQTQQKDGVATSRRRALDAALVLDYQTTRDARFLCDRDTVPTFSHVAQSVCPQVI
jgi:hypothetical protein